MVYCFLLGKDLLNLLSDCLQSWVISPMCSFIFIGMVSTGSRQMAFLPCVSFHAPSNHNFIEILSHLEHVNGFSPVCILSCTFKLAVSIRALFTHGTGKWLLSSVGPFMHLQIATLVKSFFTF